MHKLGSYWTAIEKKHGRGWILRDHHASIEDAVQYAQSMNMLAEGRIVIMQEVAEVGYAVVKETLGNK